MWLFIVLSVVIPKPGTYQSISVTPTSYIMEWNIKFFSEASCKGTIVKSIEKQYCANGNYDMRQSCYSNRYEFYLEYAFSSVYYCRFRLVPKPTPTPKPTPSRSPTRSPTRSPSPSRSPPRTPFQTPNATFAPTPWETPFQTPEITPEITPIETPFQTPEITPEITPIETPYQTPEMTPNETPDITPNETPNETPDITPNETPNETPSITPQVSPQVTPFESPFQSPFETPISTPNETLALTPWYTMLATCVETPNLAPIQTFTTTTSWTTKQSEFYIIEPKPEDDTNIAIYIVAAGASILLSIIAGLIIYFCLKRKRITSSDSSSYSTSDVEIPPEQVQQIIEISMNEVPWTQTVSSSFFSAETDPFASSFEGSDDMTVSSDYFI